MGGLPAPIQPFANFSNKELPGIGVKFVPNQTTIPVKEASTVMLRINASKNAFLNYKSMLPIYANISYPSKNVAKDFKVPTENVLETSNLTITVPPPLTTAEQLQKFVSNYITPINSVWTLLLGVGTAISSVWIYKKRPHDTGH